MNTSTHENPLKDISIKLFKEGLKSVDPLHLISQYVVYENKRITMSDINGKVEKYNLYDYENVFIIGAGKASSAMAKKLEEILGDKISDGVVITKYGFGDELKHINLFEAGHPLPDQAGVEATQKIHSICKNATENDLIISLISGGASSLLVQPVEGIGLDDIIETTNLLLQSSASIDELNIVRKHLSQVKGGRLMQTAFPAKVVSLIISDVIGDDLSTIGSGLLTPDNSTYTDALDVIKKYELFDKVPSSVLQFLIKGKNEHGGETPSSEAEIFSNCKTFLIGNNLMCLKQIGESAAELGYDSKIINSQLYGIAKDVGVKIVSEAIKFLEHGAEDEKKYCLLYGGETTVDVTGNGKGGRNQELVLAGLIELSNKKGISLLSCGTDGNDGPTDAAGAYCDENTSTLLKDKKIDANKYLSNNDSYHFFKELGDLIITGPTKTNVMDVQIVLINPNMENK